VPARPGSRIQTYAVSPLHRIRSRAERPVLPRVRPGAKIQRYERIRKTEIRRKWYVDAAYAEGYQNGVLVLLDGGDTC
jgi:hypothetical protein